MTPAQVANIMALVHKFSVANMQGNAVAAMEHCAAVEAALRDAPKAEPKRCPYCDDTGDVHSIDGEWRGTCNCPAGQATPSAPTAVEPDERAEFEAWWEQFAAEHEDWRFADSHALRWQAWQARASKGTI